MIKSRTLTDLYTEIKKDGTTIDNLNTAYSLSLAGEKDISNQSDKFWLLSYKEANAFFADDEARIWGTGNSYWLRSPHSTNIGVAKLVDASIGSIICNYVYAGYLTRPAFKI